MRTEINILPINADLYPAFYNLVQSSTWGNPMLPFAYDPNLWGYVLYEEEQMIGGWVGTIRGNIPVAKIITKSVYFDSYPIFISDEKAVQYQNTLINSLKQHAKQQGITMLNLTHWVRGNGLPVDVKEKCATFGVDLQQDNDILFKLLDSPKQRNIKKARKLELEVLACRGAESLKYLDDFQSLRETTQQRAISNNKNASMLLKSNEFFTKLMLQPNAYLLIGKYENKVVSVALLLQGGKTIYYHSGGSDIEINRLTCCSPYMFWWAFLYFKQLGIEIFDMGGVPVQADESSPAYGVYRFKRSFGGEYKEFDAGKIIISPWRYKLLSFILSQRKLLRFFSTKL